MVDFEPGEVLFGVEYGSSNKCYRSIRVRCADSKCMPGGCVIVLDDHDNVCGVDVRGLFKVEGDADEAAHSLNENAGLL